MRLLTIILLPILFLITANSLYAEKSSEKIRNQVQVLIDETRSSPNWVYIDETKHGYVGFLNKDRFLIEGPTRRAWTKVFIRGGEIVKTGQDKENSLIYRLTYRIYDCLGNRISDIKSVDYYSDGTSDSTDYGRFYKSYPEKRWTEIVPESIGDIMLKFVCGYDPS